MAGDISPTTIPSAIISLHPVSLKGLSQGKALSALFSLSTLKLSLGGESSPEPRLGEIP